jgi:hypothetical protein
MPQLPKKIANAVTTQALTEVTAAAVAASIPQRQHAIPHNSLKRPMEVQQE